MLLATLTSTGLLGRLASTAASLAAILAAVYCTRLWALAFTRRYRGRSFLLKGYPAKLSGLEAEAITACLLAPTLAIGWLLLNTPLLEAYPTEASLRGSLSLLPLLATLLLAAATIKLLGTIAFAVYHPPLATTRWLLQHKLHWDRLGSSISLVTSQYSAH